MQRKAEEGINLGIRDAAGGWDLLISANTGVALEEFFQQSEVG